MRVYLSLIILFNILFLSGCETFNSEDVNQQKITTDYELHYKADKNKTIVTATFMFGNSYLKLKDPASITFEQLKLKKKDDSFGGTYYELTFADLMSGTFRYTNTDGIIYSNFADMTNPIEIESVQLSVSRGGTVSWIGLPVQVNESVVLMIENDVDYYTFSTNTLNATSITIQNGEIPQNFVGSFDVYVTRNKSTPLNEGTSKGGNLLVKYSSEIIRTTIQS